MILDRNALTPADVVKHIAVIISCAVLFSSFRMCIVNGNSMEPTLHDGNVVFISFSHFSSPERGDIIVFDNEDCGTLVKRVIGLPGDVISIMGGVVSLNGVELSESYTAPGLYAPGDMDYPLRIPSGCYFVMGDNRQESRDSRMRCVGLVSGEDIIGKVMFM